MLGTQLRLRRIFPENRSALFAVPLDHSVSLGPIDGLEATRPIT
jgi:DhnA family fructose-bisphosphate aldolase class Ia